MGLCKCPKRQVTNQFCFEHRVNVCENCMATNHPKCIVQSYLNWLKDSDYVANCTLCSQTLEDSDCVRLTCYHVFHWECLNARQSALPENTAPGGHLCPCCSCPIFPKDNVISPVADVLKNRLSRVSWGRYVLDSPMLQDKSFENLKKPSVSVASSIVTKVHHGNSNSDRSKLNGDFFNKSTSELSQHSVVNMELFSTTSRDLQTNSRRPLLPRQSPIGGTDRDDNKYKRRTPAEIFSRWSRRFYAPSSRPPWRRTWFLVLSGVLTFIFIIFLMASIGRSTDSNDTWNDLNPNGNRLHYD